jgi:acyl carrier protein
MAEIWAGLLNLDRVGIHENFFDAGGHSLLAMQLISRVRDAFQVTLPLRTVFETPTVARLTSEVEGLRIGQRMTEQTEWLWEEGEI